MPDTGTKTTYQDMTVHVNDLIVDGTALSTTELQYLDGVTAGTVTASKAVVVDANKDIASFRDVTARNIDAGASGTAGTVDSFPSAASKGKLAMVGVANDGDTTTTISNAAMGQASVVSIPDPGAATANFVLTSQANDGSLVTSTAVELNLLDGVTATTAEINGACDVSGKLVSVADADTPFTVANSGKPHLIANVSADRTFTLPAVAAGLEYELIATVFAADGHDWIIITDADDNSEFFLGGVAYNDTNDDTVDIIAPDGDSNDTMQINVPDAGTTVKFVSDGTNWILSGFVSANAVAPTFAD